jgi:hypothetical protein
MSINWKNVKSADATGRTFDSNNGVQALQLVARNKFAWPGGYEMFVLASDGGLICSDCVQKEYRQLYHDTANKWHGTGWDVIAADATCNCDEATCDNCGRDLMAD